MATYFQGTGSEVQASPDGLQTLYLMNPNNYVPFTDNTQHPASPNMLFLNPNLGGNALNVSNLSHAPSPAPHHQPLFGITLPPNIAGSNNSDDAPGRSSFLSHHEISGIQSLSTPRIQYHLWGPVIDQTASPASGTATACSAGITVATGTVDTASQMGFRRPSQGLSLSLSSQQTPYRSLSGEIDVQAHGQLQVLSPKSDDGDEIPVTAANCRPFVSNGIAGIQSMVLGSKYLKATQELLDEVVNVGKEINKVDTVSVAKRKMNIESTTAMEDVSRGTCNNDSNSKQVTELTTAQRQELQMKKSKLVSMLDEVEHRYKQYHQQMQIVVSSFEQAVGFGAAKSYTALALKTISKQFRCLKDAISSQIKSTSNRLGEDDCLGAKIEGSRLKFVDHHLRQQRALQQLGMIQNNAWRPQRGLPERAVSVLRAWLFEHFLHPYPKDSDKVFLAKQTGLTRSQVSNWFINARVRLWKPMVEEMYMEELREQEQNNSGENTSRSKQPNKESAPAISPTQQSVVIREDQMRLLQSSRPEDSSRHNVCPAEISNSSIPNSALGGSPQSQSGFMVLGSCDMQRSPNKIRNSEMQNSSSSILSVDMDMKPAGATDTEASARFGIHKQGKDGFSFISENPNQGGVAYGAYSMGDIGSFNVPEQLAPRFHGNGVSLTLGLPHSENLSLSGNQHGIGYLSHQNIQLGRIEMEANGTEICAVSTPQSSYSSNGFNNIDMQNRKRFAAQLLPDFVA